jgi:histidinol-phosphate aminotransferase
MILPKQSLRNIKRISHPIKSRDGAVTLERNERATDLPEHILEDIKNLVTGFTLRAYPEMDDAYDALAQWSGHPVEELLFTDGADGALFRVWATYISAGDEVVTITPSYAMYPVYCDMFDAKMVALGFDDNLELPLQSVLDAVTAETRMLALVNPNQPIECAFTLEELKVLADHCQKNDVLFLVDEAYFHFYKVTAEPLIATYDNMIVARTLSKAFGLAGLRIGYLIAQQAVIDTLRALKPIYEINGLNAAITTYFLQRPKIMEDYVDAVNAGREVLATFFRAHNCSLHGQHSNTILAGLPPHVSAVSITENLRDQGWLIRAETKPPSENHLRITLGPPDLMQGLCERLAPHLKS